jgi:hypothetical protein
MSKPNTPAGEYWILYVSYSKYPSQSFEPEIRLPIAFLPTGEIDLAHTVAEDLTTANNLLAPSVQLLEEILQVSAFDIWSFFNWVFVIYYWALLAGLGQIAPTAYDVTIPFSPQPIPFPSTNNIFVNETLFQIYSGYPNSTNSTLGDRAFVQGAPVLNNETRLKPIQTTLFRSYTCSQRRPKKPLDLIVSVLVADYALIVGFYKFFVFITGWWQKRKDHGILSQKTNRSDE